MRGRSPELSLGLPNFGEWCGRDWRLLLDLARAADEAGVDRLVVTDHVLMGRNTDAYVWGRFPTPPDGPWLEPLTCLSAIAGETSKVRLATGIIIATLRPAPVLAKTVATLDALSGGRVDLGVGVGWQREEYDASGLDFDARGQLLDDTIGACRALWSQSPASYSSSTISFADVFCSPHPTQERLPVWFSGTFTARTRRRVLELGDGWIPIMGAALDDIRTAAKELRSATDRPVAVQAPLPPVRGDDGLDVAATMKGVPDLVAAGVTNVYLNAVSVARSPGAVVDRLPEVVDAFRAVTA
jgi:probable F420-dependent oxidoreductase